MFYKVQKHQVSKQCTKHLTIWLQNFMDSRWGFWKRQQHIYPLWHSKESYGHPGQLFITCIKNLSFWAHAVKPDFDFFIAKFPHKENLLKCKIHSCYQRTYLFLSAIAVALHSSSHINFHPMLGFLLLKDLVTSVIALWY